MKECRIYPKNKKAQESAGTGHNYEILISKHWGFKTLHRHKRPVFFRSSRLEVFY